MPDRCKIRFETPVIVGTGIVTAWGGNFGYEILYDGFDIAALANAGGGVGYFASFENIPNTFFVLCCAVSTTNNYDFFVSQEDSSLTFANELTDGSLSINSWTWPISEQVSGPIVAPFGGRSYDDLLPYQNPYQVDYGIELTHEQVPVGSKITFYANPPFQKEGLHLADVTLVSSPAWGVPSDRIFWQLSEYNPDSSSLLWPHFVVIEGVIYKVANVGSTGASFWDDDVYGQIRGKYLTYAEQTFPYLPKQPIWVDNCDPFIGKIASLWQSYPS